MTEPDAPAIVAQTDDVLTDAVQTDKQVVTPSADGLIRQADGAAGMDVPAIRPFGRHRLRRT